MSTPPILSTRGETIVIGMGELRVTRDPSAVLTCLGLGSCIGICFYDPISKAGGMAHVVLPWFSDAHGKDPSAKYADMGIQMLIESMQKLGATKSKLVVKIAGGAQMSMAAGFNGVFKIGEDNLKAVTTTLGREGVHLAASDTGGNRGRTVRFFVGSGKVTVATAGTEPREL